MPQSQLKQQRSHPSLDGDYAITFEICRINRARQECWGIAATEEEGYDNLILGYDASLQAFAGWAGNVHERHGSFNVGECLGWYPEPEARRIWAGVHVADPVAWARVEEGELRTFSVRGPILGSEIRVITRDGKAKPAKYVTSWKLRELSLVPMGGDRGVGQFSEIIREMQSAAIEPAATMLDALPDDCEEIERIKLPHKSMTGGHVHQHAGRGMPDDGTERPHTHFHSHLDDNNHKHDHSDVHGIARERKSKPAAFRSIPDEQWGDPARFNPDGDYRYPLTDAALVELARERLTRNAETYSAENLQIVRARIESRAKELGMPEDAAVETQRESVIDAIERAGNVPAPEITPDPVVEEEVIRAPIPTTDDGATTHGDAVERAAAAELPEVTTPDPIAAALSLGASVLRSAHPEPEVVAEVARDDTPDAATEQNDVTKGMQIIQDLKDLMASEIAQYAAGADEDIWDAQYLWDAIQRVEWFLMGERAEMLEAMRSYKNERTQSGHIPALVQTVNDLASEVQRMQTEGQAEVERAATERSTELEVIRADLTALQSQNAELQEEVTRLGNFARPGGPLLRVPPGARSFAEVKRLASDPPEAGMNDERESEVVSVLSEVARSNPSAQISGQAALMAAQLEMQRAHRNPLYKAGPEG